MRHDEFAIGVEFWTATGRWLCTDVGTRVTVAIRLDQPDPRNYDGPPYGVVEHVFDEYDLEGCALELDEVALTPEERAAALENYHPRHRPAADPAPPAA